jgi:hypothetical protein
LADEIERIDIFAELHDHVSQESKKMQRSIDDLNRKIEESSVAYHDLSDEEKEAARSAEVARRRTYEYNKAIQNAEKAASDYVKILRVQNEAKKAEANLIAQSNDRIRAENESKDAGAKKITAEAALRRANNDTRQKEIKAIEATIRQIEAEQKVVDSLIKSRAEDTAAINAEIRAKEADLRESELVLRKRHEEILANRETTNSLNAITRARELEYRKIHDVERAEERMRIEMMRTERQLMRMSSPGGGLTGFNKVLAAGLFGLDKFITKIFTLRTLFSIFKIGTILSAIGNLVGGLMSVGAAAYAAVSGLAPLISNIGALPGIMAAGAQGLGTFAIGVYGVQQALTLLMSSNADPEQVALALSKLAPAARDFVGSVMSVRPALHDLRMSVQERLFAGTGGGFKELAQTWLPLLKTELGATADALNRVMMYWKGIFLRPDVVKAVVELMENNVSVIDFVGKGLGEWAGNFAKILALASPTLVRMSKDFFDSAMKWGDWIDKHQGLISDFFSNGYDLLKDVWQVIKNIGVGLFNIGKASQFFGNNLGKSFSDWSEKFRKWTGSDEGQKRLQDFFKKMEPIFNAIVKLFGGLGNAIVKIAETPGIEKVFDKLGKLVNPVRRLIQESMKAGYLDAFIKVIKALADVAAAGWLGIAASAFTNIAAALEVIASVIAKIPDPLKHALGSVMGILFAYGLVSRIGKGIGVGSLLGRAAGGIGGRAAAGRTAGAAGGVLGRVGGAGGAAAIGGALLGGAGRRTAGTVAGRGIGGAVAGGLGGVAGRMVSVPGGKHAGKWVEEAEREVVRGRGKGGWANLSRAASGTRGVAGKLFNLRSGIGMGAIGYGLSHTDNPWASIGGTAGGAALIGSNFGPWGTAIGAAIGGLVGAVKFWDTKIRTEANKHIQDFMSHKKNVTLTDDMLKGITSSDKHKRELADAIKKDPIAANDSLRLSKKLGYYVPPTQAKAFVQQDKMATDHWWSSAHPNVPERLPSAGAPGTVEANDAWIKKWNQQASAQRKAEREIASAARRNGAGAVGFMKANNFDRRQGMISTFLRNKIPNAGDVRQRSIIGGALGMHIPGPEDNASGAQMAVYKTIKAGDQAITDYMANVEKQFVRSGGKDTKVTDAVKAFDSVIKEINHFLEVTKSRMGSFAQQIRYRSIYGISQGGLLEGTYTGGEVAAGDVRMVGERGPEAFMSKTGDISMLGTRGQEVVKFATAGAVINNPATSNPWTTNPDKTPSWAINSLQGIYTNVASALVGARGIDLDNRFVENTAAVTSAATSKMTDSRTMEILANSVDSLSDAVAKRGRTGRLANDSRNSHPPAGILQVNGGNITKDQFAAWFREFSAAEKRKAERR